VWRKGGGKKKKKSFRREDETDCEGKTNGFMWESLKLDEGREVDCRGKKGNGKCPLSARGKEIATISQGERAYILLYEEKALFFQGRRKREKGCCGRRKRGEKRKHDHGCPTGEKRSSRFNEEEERSLPSRDSSSWSIRRRERSRSLFNEKVLTHCSGRKDQSYLPGKGELIPLLLRGKAALVDLLSEGGDTHIGKRKRGRGAKKTPEDFRGGKRTSLLS